MQADSCEDAQGRLRGIRMGRTRALRAIDCSCTALSRLRSRAAVTTIQILGINAIVLFVYVTALWVASSISRDAGIVDSFSGGSVS